MKSTVLKAIALSIVVLMSFGCQDKLGQQRQAFLLAESYIAEHNESGFKTAAAGLEDYPLYPYLRYQWLQNRLDRTSEITEFLASHKDTRFAQLLRGKWLRYLAEQNRWQEFVQHYQQNEHSNDDCRWLWARYQTGDAEKVLVEVKRLWLTGENSDTCQPLFGFWLASEPANPDLIWQRFEATLFQNRVGAAQSAANLLSGADKRKAENWLELHANPGRLEEKRFWPDKKDAQAGRFFADTIIRLADDEVNKAITVWDRNQNDFALDDGTKQRVTKKIGMELLADKDSRAFDQLNKVEQPDEEVRAAKLRAALFVPNWQQLKTAIAGLTEAERKEPKAKYWYARALHAEGNSQQAEDVFQEVAKDRSLYGFMAADKVIMPYKIAHQPIKPDSDVLSILMEQPEFKACRELHVFGRDSELRSQWQFAIKTLSQVQLLAAAKLAQNWQWDQLAITTLVKAGYWDDMDIRFPVRYRAEVEVATKKYGLNPALVMGLMRQESMLDPKATSPVGALGLMQMMPQTARVIASELKQALADNSDLYRPEINIGFGTYYLSGLISRLGKQIPVAVAAYNAGPNLVNKWLPTRASVPADLWIETIPYKETRKYVGNVLAYAMIYQAKWQKSSLKLKDLLSDIGPV